MEVQNSTPDQDEELIRGQKDQLPIYETHGGTIRVGGGTPAFQCGLAAFHQFRKGTRPVEFSFIGANAGQQAIKAANVAIRAIRTYTNESWGIIPLWCNVKTKKPDGAEVIKDGCLLRLVQLSDDVGALLGQNAPELDAKVEKSP